MYCSFRPTVFVQPAPPIGKKRNGSSSRPAGKRADVLHLQARKITNAAVWTLSGSFSYFRFYNLFYFTEFVKWIIFTNEFWDNYRVHNRAAMINLIK